MDATYEKVRENGQIRDAAVLIATGIAPNGVRSVLGISVSLSEQEEHWKELLRNLKDRGMNGVKLVISDAHAGLGAARRAILGSVPWQRCQFHLQQNAQAYIHRQSKKKEVSADIRSVFNASDRQSAEATLQLMVNKYAKSAPRLSAWMEEDLPDGFTVFDLSEVDQDFE